MYIIAGLGNPGTLYAQTRHNVGFDAVDYLAASYRIDLNKSKFQAVYGLGMIQGEKVIIVKPQTFMNLSGNAIFEIMKFYQVEPDKLIVIYDDIDLAVGKIRIRPSGSAGTHNGMRSIIGRIGAESFPRVRIGVGKPPPGWKLADYVLSRFSTEERKAVIDAIERTSTAVPAVLCAGIESAQSRYNG